MKKTILLLAAAAMTLAAGAQSKFQTTDFGSFKLHTQATADPLGDMSSIIETPTSLIIVEPAAFRSDIAEQQEYVAALGKPVERIIVNYHSAGLTAYDADKYAIIEGMPEFINGEIYSGMMSGFAQAFGDAIATEGDLPSTTVPRNGSESIGGVSFVFSNGSNSDFPGASILIGGKVFYTHFTPAAGAHMSPLQITNRAAVDAQLAAIQAAKDSGAVAFIGGHGVAATGIEAVDFQIAYLKTVKQLLETKATADEFSEALINAYPVAAAQENVAALAQNLYK